MEIFGLTIGLAEIIAISTGTSFLLSELMAVFPKAKSNSIMQLLYNITSKVAKKK